MHLHPEPVTARPHTQRTPDRHDAVEKGVFYEPRRAGACVVIGWVNLIIAFLIDEEMELAGKWNGMPCHVL